MAERQRPRNKTKACTQQRVNDIKLREDLRKIAKLERKYFLPLARGVFFCGRKCRCWWHRLRNQSQRLNFDGRYFEADIRREIKKLTSVQATARRPKPVERANDFLSKCFFFAFFSVDVCRTREVTTTMQRIARIHQINLLDFLNERTSQRKINTANMSKPCAWLQTKVNFLYERTTKRIG